MSAKGEVDLDSQVRGVEAAPPQTQKNASDCLEMLLGEAVKLLKQAEDEVKIRKLKVVELKTKLEEAKRIEEKIKKANADSKQEEKQSKPEAEEEKKSEEAELARKAAIRRKWRVLGMKVRVGVTANIVRRRKINDANSFLDKESEAVTKEDSLDLEGKCEQKKTMKSKWRRGGTLRGDLALQGRDSAF